MQRVKVEVEPTRSALATAMLNSKNNTSGCERLWDTALKFFCPGLFITSPDQLEKHYFSLLIFNINWWNTLRVLCGNWVDCWWYDSLFFKESSAGSLLNIFLSIYYVGDIWSDLTKFWGPTVGILTKTSSEKSNAPHMPGVSPLGLNIDKWITFAFPSLGDMQGFHWHFQHEGNW